MQRNAKDYANKPALVFADQELSWSQLWQRVEPAAQNIAQRLGGNNQEVISLLLPNSVDFVVCYLAIVHSGHIAFPLDPAYKQLELDAIIEEIPAKLIITNKAYRHHFGGSGVPVMMVDELGRKAQPARSLLRQPADKQIASLTFTSGTTGTPKAAPNTHANHIWNIEVCSKVWQWTGDDTLLIALPLSHWYGIVMGVSGALYHGNTLYLHDWFDEKLILDALSSGKISFFTHISQAYLKLLEIEGDYDLSKVRLCVSGGAPLAPETWRQFKHRYGLEILETYGSSETGRIAANALGQPMIGSPGKILPGVNMKLSQDSEVLVKSPGIFPGYFSNPEATKTGYTKDGYFRTGDIGEMRGEHLFLKGRVAERIRRFGYTISPRDVEWAMRQNPQIKDIYVMGHQNTAVPDDELIYFLVSDLSEAKIRDYCKQNLLFAWRPDRIIHLKDLPRTNSGKPRIAHLKQLIEQGT